MYKHQPFKTIPGEFGIFNKKGTDVNLQFDYNQERGCESNIDSHFETFG